MFNGSEQIQEKQRFSFSNQVTERLQYTFNFCISEQKIVHVDSFKYPGLTLQSGLHWKTQLTSLEKKLRRSIDLLSKIRQYVPKFLLKTIYYFY